MFKKNKCSNCGEKISKNFEFCPHCGVEINERGNKEDYGILGKNDFEEMGIKLPMGLNMMLKPLMKELSKQMAQLDKEIRNEQGKNLNVPNARFSIHFATPGQKPMRIDGVNNAGRVAEKSPKRILQLPKISSNNLKKIKALKKSEPETNVRRFADKIVYEINLPGVGYLENINISKLENAVEIKAFSDEELFVKEIEVDLPLLNYGFEKENLVLEFGLR